MVKSTRAGTKRPEAATEVQCFDCQEWGKLGGMMQVRRYPYADKTLDVVVYVHRKHGR